MNSEISTSALRLGTRQHIFLYYCCTTCLHLVHLQTVDLTTIYTLLSLYGESNGAQMCAVIYYYIYMSMNKEDINHLSLLWLSILFSQHFTSDEERQPPMNPRCVHSPAGRCRYSTASSKNRPRQSSRHHALAEDGTDDLRPTKTANSLE
jgi:hypothetical protein